MTYRSVERLSRLTLLLALFVSGLAVAVLAVMLGTWGRIDGIFPRKEVTPVLTTERLIVRIPNADPAIFDNPTGMTVDNIAAIVEQLKMSVGPFKTCWVSTDGIELEVCTPAGLGEEHHQMTVAALQEEFPNLGPCAGE